MFVGLVVGFGLFGLSCVPPALVLLLLRMTFCSQKLYDPSKEAIITAARCTSTPSLLLLLLLLRRRSPI